MSESNLQRRIVKSLRTYDDVWCFVVHGGPYQQAGIPDIIGVCSGSFFALEVKLPGHPHPVTKLQQATMDVMSEAGAAVAVVTTVGEAVDVVEQVRARGN